MLKISEKSNQRPVSAICKQSKTLKGTEPWTKLTVSDFFLYFYCFNRGTETGPFLKVFSFHCENKLNIMYSLNETVIRRGWKARDEWITEMYSHYIHVIFNMSQQVLNEKRKEY